MIPLGLVAFVFFALSFGAGREYGEPDLKEIAPFFVCFLFTMLLMIGVSWCFDINSDVDILYRILITFIPIIIIVALLFYLGIFQTKSKSFLCSICEDETNYNKKLKICYKCEREIEREKDLNGMLFYHNVWM